MIDSYVLLTPILLLGVMAVAGFVGCGFTAGVASAAIPTNLHAVPGDAKVDLTWDDYPDAIGFNVYRGLSSGTLSTDYPPPTPITPDDVPYTDHDVLNGTKYFYRISALVPDFPESSLSNEDSATPMAAEVLEAFVTQTTTGTPRTNFDGWAGMEIQVGATPLDVRKLGRIVDSSHAGTHDVIIVDHAMMDQIIRTVPVDVATAAIGEFAYASLTSPVTLSAGAVYYILSRETVGVEFYDVNTTVMTTGVASVLGGVYSSDVMPPYTYTRVPNGNPNIKQSYGPVSFEYVKP